MSEPDPIPAGAPDRAAASAMWQEYAAARPAAVAACADHTVEHFGDSAELADELLSLVLAGGKRATSALVADFLAEGEALPRVASHWVACDGRGAPRVILRSTELRVGTFADADADVAAAEGEDDLSLESWRREHRRYWTRGCEARWETWTEDHEIVFERFSVVWPPEHADVR